MHLAGTTERLANITVVLDILQKMEQNLEIWRMENQTLKEELSQVRQELQEVRTTLSQNPQPTRVMT